MDLESIYRQTGGLPPSAFQHEFATTSYVEHDFLQHDLNEYLFDLVENHDYSGDNSGTLYSRHNELDVSQQEEHLPDYCFSRELELGYVADSSDEPESFPLENPTGMLAEVPLDAVNGQLEQPVTPPRQSRNTSKRLQQEAKRLLETHFEKQPYPEKHEMMSMAQKTKLKLKQVKTWFSNTPARRLKKLDEQETSALNHHNFSPIVSNSLTQKWTARDGDIAHDEQHSRQSSNRASLTRSSLASLEHMSDQNAYDPVSTYLDQSMEPNLEGVGALFDSREFSSRFSPYGRSSSRADSDTSGRTYGSSTNHSSVGSVISTNSRLSRRGRRRYLSHQTTSHISQNKKGVTIWKDSNSKKYRYFCTFCSDPFPDRYSWNRHEESIHMPRTLWVCSFDTQIPTEKGPCDYCLEIIEHNDWTRHLSSHRYAECALRREIDRTFYRKDHFKQHLVGFHRMSHCVVQSWPDGSRQDAPPLLPGCLELRCGLCGQHCKDWKMRVDHVADHFEKGAIEAQWHFRRAYDAHLSGLKQAE